MPRDSNARVKTPVPAPSSNTGPSEGETCCVMSRPSDALDGAMADTRCGSAIHDRKNRKKSDVAQMAVIGGSPLKSADKAAIAAPCLHLYTYLANKSLQVYI